MFTRKMRTKSTRKACPSGYILRKGYTRKYRNTILREGYEVRRAGRTIRVRPSSYKVRVESSCIKDRGLAGKGPKYITGLKQGDLLKHGYTYRLPTEYRHVALGRAINEFGALGVYRKLNAVAKLSTRTAPAASSVFSKDRNWVRAHHTLHKE